MVEPVGRLDKRRAAPCERVSNTNAVGRGTEMDLLLRCCRRLRRCGGFILCRLIYCADEANTLARDGPNQPLLIATVADRFAGGIRLSRVESDTIRPPQTEAIRSSLLTTRSRFWTRYSSRSNTCGSSETSSEPRRSSRRSESSIWFSKQNCTLAPAGLFTLC